MTHLDSSFTVTGMFRLTGGILPMGVVFICMPFLWLHKVEGTDCSAKSHLNGITFHLHERVSSCNEYNWCVNNTVAANEARFNPMMVLSRDSRSITFKICYDNVTYKNACDGKIINCSSCPTNPATEVQSPRTLNMLMVLFGSYLFVL